VAGFSSKPAKKITPNPPPRHGNQQGTLSAKTRRALRLYEEDLRVRYAQRTGPHYLADVRCFLDWLEARAIDLATVRSEDLQAYQADLYAMRKKGGKPYAVSSQHGRLTAVKSFFRFLYRRGYALHDPAATLQLPRMEKRLPRTVLTREEARKILDGARSRTPRGLRDRAILETLYATGVRVTELANLTPYDVDTEERVLRVVLGKGAKDRNLPLTTAAAKAIEAYLLRGRPKLVGPRSAHLFLSPRGLQLDRTRLNRIVRAAAQKAGIKKHVTCHTFRHSVATHLLKGRADIRHIQALLGHASLSSTERYTRVELSDLREVVRRAHPRGR
jgi:integrase/recombinase XerD